VSNSALHRQRRAEGKCYSCGAKLFPEWGARCPECRDYERKKQRRWRRSQAGKLKTRELRKKYVERNRTKVNEAAKKLRERKKVAGVCLYCSAACLDDSLLCALHRTRHRKAARNYARRKAQEAKQ